MGALDGSRPEWVGTYSETGLMLAISERAQERLGLFAVLDPTALRRVPIWRLFGS